MTVPGPDGSSFAIELAYHSGTSPDAGVSWVGYGWSLNPGGIIRDTRGLPDDWRAPVTYWDKQKPSWTITAQPKVNIEFNSVDSIKPGTNHTADTLFGAASNGLNITPTFRFNSHTGFATAIGLSAMVKGQGGLSFAKEDEDVSFSAYINPSALLGADGTKPYPTHTGSHFQLFRPASVSLSISSDRDRPVPIVSPAQRSIASYSEAILYSNPALFGLELGVEGSLIIQTPEESYSRMSYGYMHSRSAISDNSSVMDYRIDNPVSYKKGDDRLAIPFSSPDNFVQTGSVGGGSFRLWNRGAGHFRPNGVDIEAPIMQYGWDMSMGTRFGIGLRFAKGVSLLTAGDWIGDASGYSFLSTNDQPYFFRAHGDPGGSVSFATNDSAVRSTVLDPSISSISFPSSLSTVMNSGQRNAGVLDIEMLRNFWFIPRLNYEPLTLPYWFSGGFARSFHSDKDVDRTNYNLIGEISVSEDDGTRLIYGYPIYARNETRLALGLEGIAGDTSVIKGMYRAHAHFTPDNTPLAQGEEREGMYASAFLLTERLSPGYVDRAGDGPTIDDFGGYTKFTHRKVLGLVSRNEAPQHPYLYAWRSPITGFYYDRNSLSDASDDVGTFSGGLREVTYPQTIETKTHVAVFVTNHTDLTLGEKHIQGSGSERHDAVPAGGISSASIAGTSIMYSDHEAAARDSTDGPASREVQNPSEVLERIELYSRDAQGNPDVLLQTVHLEYDYSLRPGMPNSDGLTPPAFSDRAGMLTLKRIWVQEQNVVSPTITPYEFGYEYGNSSTYPVAVSTQYPSIAGFADSLSPLEQNPRYSSFDTDNWGDYQYKGNSRLRHGRPWVNQNPDTNAFDPAAWQLKWIRMPSRAEIHVQYEQNDYQYVQDRAALAMVSLRGSIGDSLSLDSSNMNRYYLGLSDIGVDSSDRSEVFRLRSLIEKEFVDRNHKIYFRLLYALIGDTAHFDRPERNSEYVSGYASVESVRVDSLAVGGGYQYNISLLLRDEQGRDVPKDVCHDLVEKTKRGKLGSTPEPILFEDDVARSVTDFLWMVPQYTGLDPNDHCRAIDYTHSYIRIPLVEAKKGGGIRTKRLLALNAGAEGDTTLTGTEYLYQTYDENRKRYISSGVATNEPQNGREENALVDLLASGHALAQVVSGKDRVKHEGILGESLLPGPSVGYARVVSRSINSGATSPGFSVQEFHTAREFPFDGHYPHIGNSIEQTDLDLKESSSPILEFMPVSLINVHFDNVWLTKGYRFFINSMHGAQKASANYGGTYSDPDSWHLNSLQELTYFAPAEPIPVVDSLGGPIRFDTPGKEMEVTLEDRMVSEVTADAALEADVYFFPLPPSITGAGYLSYQENIMRTHVTTKVVRSPVFVRSSLSYSDGMYHGSENVAFDPVTGGAVITATSDSYDRLNLHQSTSGHQGTYHSFSLPAHREYPALGQRAWSERFEAKSSRTSTGLQIYKHLISSQPALTISSSTGSGINEVVERLTPGDLILVRRIWDTTFYDFDYYQVRAIDGATVHLSFVSTSLDFSNVDTGKVDLTIVRTARTNQPGAAAGSVVTYGLSRSEVDAGTYLTRTEPAGFSDRTAFAALLTAHIATGDPIPPTALPSGLKFRDGDGDCVTPTLDISLVVTTTMLKVESPGGIDQLDRYGAGEHFAIEEDGTLVYFATSEPSSRQPLTHITFCPESHLYVSRTMDGVIAASAQPLDDSLAYSFNDYPKLLIDPNSYELGKRGRWQARRGYAYRGAITPGGNRTLAERNYKNAGVFPSFTLFNFRYPDANDTSSWMKLDTITEIDPNGVPLETRSRLGITSCIHLGHRGTLPILAAENAEHKTVGFQSFEESTANVDSAFAHTGFRSLKVPYNNTISDPISWVFVNGHVASKGVLVRLWARYATRAAEQASPLVLIVGSQTIPLDTNDRVAKVGEWGLYEAFVPGSSLTPSAYSNVYVKQPDGSTLDIWVDDVRVQPSDAEMTAMVYDTRTLRPIATLDADNFATIAQYDARGRVVRSIVETERGMRTVVEVHSNLPGIARVEPPGALTATKSPTDGGSTTINVRRSTPVRFDDGEEGTTTLREELLKIELGPDGHRVDVFGGKKIPEAVKKIVERLSPGQLDSIARWDELDQQLREREIRSNEELSDQERRAVEASIAEIRENRNRILNSLGVSEEEMKALVELARSDNAPSK